MFSTAFYFIFLLVLVPAIGVLESYLAEFAVEENDANTYDIQSI
jgi:hypothetical protein